MKKSMKSYKKWLCAVLQEVQYLSQVYFYMVKSGQECQTFIGEGRLKKTSFNKLTGHQLFKQPISPKKIPLLV